MKKFFACFLAILMLCGCITAAAEETSPVTPVIVITGYGTPFLYEDYGTDSQTMAWPFSPADVAGFVLKDMKNGVPAAFKALLGDTADFGSCIARGGIDILPYMFCNPDGTSVGNLSHIKNDPATTNYTYLLKENKYIGVYEYSLTGWLSNEIGGENVFVFQYDFRMGAYDITNELEQYIHDVLDYTGASKVDMFGLSYGGFLTGVYLSRFGTQGLVDNAVLSVPALRGSSFARDFLMGDADLPVDSLLTYAESAIGLETSFGEMTSGMDYSKINTLAAAFLTGINDMPLYWGSMWDLLTPADYNELKGELLDSTESAAIIEKSDYIHYEIMPNYAENFAACQKNGTKISILCSTGNDIAFGDDVNADMLIDASSVSGSTCAPLGERFEDGYVACCTNCKDKSHYHVSPSMEIDASSAYLPENTWFVDGQFHGMYSFEDYTFSLVKLLLLADESIDIYTYDEYPQFKASTLTYYGVYAAFDSSDPGYVNSDDTALVVKNISDKFPIKLSSVTCDGMDITFDLSDVGYIKPGESVVLPFSGEIPAVSAERAAVNITFARIGSVTPYDNRTLDFTIRNGSAPVYAGGYTATDFEHTDADLSSKISVIINSFISFFKELFSNIFG